MPKKADLNDEYFYWLCRIVCDDNKHKKLLIALHNKDFQYVHDRDENRLVDGECLRDRFCDECKVDEVEKTLYLDKYSCSILEMMIALSLRCEEQIMDNPDLGNRTGQWFWSMIVNLGLGRMTDDKFDEEYVDDILERFLDLDYSPNGEGGLFYVRNPKYDMRDAEIWYQMCWYLAENM